MGKRRAKSLIGKFTADTKINIRGGEYPVTDTGDGYYTIHDMPIMSEVPKGTKGAPEAIGKEQLEDYVKNATRKYEEGNFCATAFVGHNPDVELTHPEFAGFVLPKRVAKYKFEDGDERWTVYGDTKLTKEKFSLFKEGKLPYHSPEVHWAKKRITGLAFLDTQPPHFEYALNTPGPVKQDKEAKFNTVFNVAKFMADEPKQEDDSMNEEKFGKMMDEKLPQVIGKYMDENLPKHLEKLMPAIKDSSNKKPDPLPQEPSGKMSADPELAAKFSALVNQNAELAKRLDDRDNRERAQALLSIADQSLSGKVITAPLREQIGSFAADWATEKNGEEKMKKYIEVLKPSLRDKPPTNLAEFHGVGNETVKISADDAVLAKFAAEGPEYLDQIAKFSAQYRQLKATLGDRISYTEETFIKNELARFKGIRSGEIKENKGGN